MSSIALYQITDAYKQLEGMLDGDMDEAEFFAAIDTIDGALKDKATNVGMFIRNLEATADAIKAAEGAMSDRRRAIENRVKSIKAYVLRNMEAAGITKIECPLFVLSIRNNPLSVVVDDEKQIPADYMRQPEPPAPEPDKKKILEDIKQGVVIDGVHTEQRKSLVIK